MKSDFIAAAVPSVWLAMLTAKTSTANVRLHRQRLREGKWPVLVLIDAGVISYLIEGGWLQPHEIDDKTLQGRATSQLLVSLGETIR